MIASFADSVVQFRGALIGELLRRHATVTVIAPPCQESTRVGIERLGVRLIAVPMIRNGISPLADLVTFYRLTKVLRQLRPTHVLSYTIKPVVFGSLAARLAGVSSVSALITGLGYVFVGFGLRARVVGYAARALLRLALGCCHSVIFQNDDDREFLRELGMIGRRVRIATVNGSGVPLRDFSLAPMPKDVSFLMIARFVREKGVLEYMKAAEVVRGRHPEVSVRLLGWAESGLAGLSQSEVANLARFSGVDVLARTEDVRPAIRECAVFVLPSYREGTPRTVLEAMAMGRPVITTDVPGCRQTVQADVTGWLVPPRNADALAAAMCTAIEARDRLEAMGLAGRRRAEMRFDADSVARATADAMGVTC